MIVAALLGFAQMASPAAQARESASPRAADTPATRKIADALIGHTLLLKAADRQADTDSILYFLRDGTGRGKRGEVPMPFKWLINLDGKLCIVEAKIEFRDSDCYALSIDGDAVTVAAPDRPAIPGKLLKGNPLKL